MLNRIGLMLLVAGATCGAAIAQQTSDANLLQDWVCPAGTCNTQCVGPGGPLTISAHDVKVFQFALHIRRLWLDADGSIFVLGDDDRCEFGGAVSSPINFVSQPPPVSSLGPPVPGQCYCVGNQCNPPGCTPSSPLQ